MAVVVFDLDDTLYDDLSFVRSGFAAVAQQVLAPLLSEHPDKIQQALEQELQISRNQVFDRFLQKYGLYSQRLVLRCLSVYRRHFPSIHLFPEAENCLKRLKHLPLYVVTDGNKLVQKNKCLALGLQSKVRKCLCTYAYGRKHSKPSPYCFYKICQLEKVDPHQVVYVADNPYKDFVGLKPLGFHTIRVLTGPYRRLILDAEHEADIRINSLEFLDEKLLEQLEVESKS